MEGPYLIAGIGVIGLSALGSIALYKGVNGKLLTSISSTIALVVGFCFGQAI